MKLIKSSFEIYEQSPGIEGVYEAIERAGRTCYKSERPEGSTAKDFVDRMVKSGHGAMLEHGTVYLCYTVPRKAWRKDNDMGNRYYKNPYSKIVSKYDEERDSYTYYITTNFRVLVENDWLNDLYCLCEPTEFHEKRVMVKFNTDIGVTREANRHRKNSVAEQSTRYCNYSRDKFGGNIAVAIPTDIKESDIYHCINQFSDPGENPRTFYNMCTALVLDTEEFNDISTWLFANLACEWAYMRLIKLGWKPQQARRILPLDTHSELVHTAFVSDWKHFSDLRSKGITGAPHPDMKAIADPLYEEFIKRGLI